MWITNMSWLSSWKSFTAGVKLFVFFHLLPLNVWQDEERTRITVVGVSTISSIDYIKKLRADIDKLLLVWLAVLNDDVISVFVHCLFSLACFCWIMMHIFVFFDILLVLIDTVIKAISILLKISLKFVVHIFCACKSFKMANLHNE